MAIDSRSDAAAAAAAEAARQRAIEEARRRAEEAKERAAAQARKVAEAQKAQAALTKAAKPKVLPDELSTGRGGALRRGAISQLAAQGLPSATASTTVATPATFKMSDLVGRTMPSSATLLADPTGTSGTPAATTTSVSDDPETRRAQAAQQDVVDQAVAGLPADQAAQVKAAAQQVIDANNAQTDPAQRAQATADAIAAQSAQFKGNPKAAAAFVQATATQQQEIGEDLGNAPDAAKGVFKSLASACDNLGAGAGMSLGHIVDDGIPQGGMDKLKGAIGDVGKDSDGGRTLLFGMAQGFQALGQPDDYKSLEGAMKDAMFGQDAHELVRPVDPNDPDAAGKAELKLEEARYADQRDFGEYTEPHEFYAEVLRAQKPALEKIPGALHDVAVNQQANIEELIDNSPENGDQLALGFDMAQQNSGAEVQRLAEKYADKFAQTNVPMDQIADSVSPDTAKELAFAFAKAGRTDMAKVFADKAVTVLDDVKDAAKDANDKVDDDQKQLEKELDKVGASLTDDQKHDYESKFWAKHQGDLDKQKSANADLAKALSTDADGLKKLAAIDPKAANAVSGVLNELARDPDQADFVDQTIDGLKDANGAFPAGFQNVESDLVKATQTADEAKANKALSEGDTEAAAEALEHLQGFLELTQFASKDVRELVKSTLPDLKAFTGVLSTAVKTGDYTKIGDFLKDPENVKKFEELGKDGGDLGKSIGTFAKGVGVAVYLLQASNAPGGKEQALDVLHATQYGTELLADGFHKIGDATREATSAAVKAGGEALDNLATTLDKFAPVVNLGVALFQDASSISDAVNDPNLKTIGAAVGDAVSAIGAGIALVPGGQLLGATLYAVGAAVRVLSAFIEGIFEGNETADEEKDILKDVYDDSANDPNSALSTMSEDDRHRIASQLVDSNTNLNDFAKDADLTPDQLIQLADKINFNDFNSQRLNDLAKASDLKGQAFVDYLSGLGNDKVEAGLDRLVSLGDAHTAAGQRLQNDWTSYQFKHHDAKYADFYKAHWDDYYHQALVDQMTAAQLLPR